MSSSGDTTLFDILRKKTRRQVGFSIGQRWDQKTKTDPFLRDAVFCADLVFGNGKTYRVATKPITVYDSDQMIPYIPMLVNDPSVKNTYDFKGGSASQRSVKIDLDARLLDPLEIILNGSFLMGVGEISLQVDGEQYEDRFVLIRGDMKGGITFGAKEEVLSLSIGDLKLSVDQIIPKAVTDKRGFSTMPDDQLGFRFPLALTDCRFIPAIKLSADDYGPTFLCCYGTDHNVSEIYVDGELMPATVSYQVSGFYYVAINWTQVSGEDDQGNPWTGIKFRTQNVPAFKDKTVYSSLVNKSGTSSNVIEVVERLLTDHTVSGGLQYDRVLHAKTMAKAGGSLFGSLCVNGSDEQNTATVLSYIEGSICKEFAMLKPVYTGHGYGIVMTDRTSSITKLELVRGQGLLIDRVSAITESPAQSIYNRFTIRYNFNALTNNYAGVIVRYSGNSKLCRMSRALLGDREMKPIDSVLIKDDETASALIDWYVNHYTLPTYTVQYCATPRLFFIAQIGDNVFLTDEKIGFNRVSATIKGLELKDGKCIVDFLVWLQYEGIQ